MDQSIKTVLCIPGLWPTRDNLVAAIAESSDGFAFAGGILIELATQQTFVCEVRPHDPQLRSNFERESHGRINQQTLEAIEKHTYAFYLIGSGGSPKAARSLMKAAAGILRAGGLAISVLSAGIAHNVSGWKTLSEFPEDTALYHAYVSLYGQPDHQTYYSCGMHNMGLRDAIVTGDLNIGDVTQLLQIFLMYTLIENPGLINGHTFSLNEQSPRYELRTIPCTTYPTNTLLYNPFGMWQLIPR